MSPTVACSVPLERRLANFRATRGEAGWGRLSPPRPGGLAERIAAALGGEMVHGQTGTFIRIEAAVEHLPLDRTCLARLPGHPGEDVPLLCPDTETAGRGTATGTAVFLVGLGWWRGPGGGPCARSERSPETTWRRFAPSPGCSPTAPDWAIRSDAPPPNVAIWQAWQAATRASAGTPRHWRASTQHWQATSKVQRGRRHARTEPHDWNVSACWPSVRGPCVGWANSTRRSPPGATFPTRAARSSPSP